MKQREFSIGGEFLTATSTWRRIDIGARTSIAIKVSDHEDLTDARRHARIKVALHWVIRCDPTIIHKWPPKASGHSGFLDGI